MTREEMQTELAEFLSDDTTDEEIKALWEALQKLKSRAALALEENASA